VPCQPGGVLPCREWPCAGRGPCRIPVHPGHAGDQGRFTLVGFGGDFRLVRQFPSLESAKGPPVALGLPGPRRWPVPRFPGDIIATFTSSFGLLRCVVGVSFFPCSHTGSVHWCRFPGFTLGRLDLGPQERTCVCLGFSFTGVGNHRFGCGGILWPLLLPRRLEGWAQPGFRFDRLLQSVPRNGVPLPLRWDQQGDAPQQEPE